MNQPMCPVLAISYILDQTEDVKKANVYVMMPIPFTLLPVVNNDYLTAQDTGSLTFAAGFLDLIMDSISVVQVKALQQAKFILGAESRDGHAPFLWKRGLQAYTIGSCTTDHSAASL